MINDLLSLIAYSRFTRLMSIALYALFILLLLYIDGQMVTNVVKQMIYKRKIDLPTQKRWSERWLDGQNLNLTA